MFLTTVSYDAEVRHDGRLYEFNIPNLEVPVCRACGKKVFTEKVDAQINAALRAHLHLLTPAEMCAALERLQMTQKDVAERLGIAEATLSRWLNEWQIQSRALDNLLRLFFAFPDVRAALNGASQDPHLGTADILGQRQQADRQVDPALTEEGAAMSNAEQQGVRVIGRTGKRFEGFQLGTYAAALHAALRFGNTPRRLEDLIQETEAVARTVGIADIGRRVRSHLRYWESRNVYLETEQGWMINPKARFDPEWQGADEGQAEQWYRGQCHPRSSS
ncbi:MAG: helix-turn-helix domain-containing protein [Gemmataceae bacterium]|nr:helix-turn-helix domain-containing protein [Gemmataceae bacterium]